MHAAASPPGPQTPQAFDTEFTLQLEKLRELLGTYLQPLALAPRQAGSAS